MYVYVRIYEILEIQEHHLVTSREGAAALPGAAARSQPPHPGTSVVNRATALSTGARSATRPTRPRSLPLPAPPRPPTHPPPEHHRKTRPTTHPPRTSRLPPARLV